MGEAAGERKRGRPTEAERALRHDRILDEALALFASRGYGAVTIDELALSAQVTKRTIYAYFGDKAGVFTAVIERFRAQAGVVSGAGVLETATRIVEVLFSDSAVAMHRLMIAEAQQFPELAASFYDSGPRSYVALLGASLGEPDPEPPAERDSLAEALFGLLLGEPHRRRLLGLAGAPTPEMSRIHAERALALLGIGA
ncbi:TetR/AcrR family transcriptional regulator [Leucobacter aridicollis]|uniref:AcrR family transcriptional regulator n=1 Tax=Leucobacter aridicollis TaxID=283878 RepID=A0A852QUH9_9MICO|nr:TetR/AcrR family transcriptional regulator [Leucobacter aridicollis]MBL3682515.1 TetR/AcrR family transcriptional regulator [Leucobacter aridicollis]NYD25933.1 AcrR family transcriptional regulator [Leucobacter aridicollis]